MADSSGSPLEWPDPLALSGAELARGVTFEVPSVRDVVDPMLDLVSALLGRSPLTERQVKDVRQAILEMVANAMEWGHHFASALSVRITYRLTSDAVVVTVEDEGPGFLPGARFRRGEDLDGDGEFRPPPAIDLTGAYCLLPAEEVYRGRGFHQGVGIMLARGIVDELTYNDPGNHVTLVKRFVP